MKNTMYFRKALTMHLMVAMVMALFVPFAFASNSVQADGQTVGWRSLNKALKTGIFGGMSK